MEVVIVVVVEVVVEAIGSARRSDGCCKRWIIGEAMDGASGGSESYHGALDGATDGSSDGT